MSGILTSQKWLERTYVFGRTRSSELKALDTVIAAYDRQKTDENLGKIQEKLTKWIVAKGKGWEGNERNRQHAFTNLQQELQERLEKKVRAAPDLDFWKKARKKAAKRLFYGTTLEIKGEYTRFYGTGLSVTEVGRTGLNAYSITEGASLVEKLCKHVADAQVPSVVLPEVVRFLSTSGILPTLAAQTATSLIPFKGLITSGGVAIKSLIQIAIDQYTRSVVADHEGVVDKGSPRAALASMKLIIEREEAAHTRAAVQAGTEFAARAIATAFDPTNVSQTLIGAGSALASLSQRVFLIGRDFKERYDANRRLLDPENIDVTIFQTHPILGCYFLVCSETSSVISFINEFGEVGWMDDVEAAVKDHLTPLEETAAGYMDSARFELVRGGAKIWAGPSLWKQAKKLVDGKWANLTPEEYKELYGVDLPPDFKERIVGMDIRGYERFVHEKRAAEVWNRFNRRGPETRARSGAVTSRPRSGS